MTAAREVRNESYRFPECGRGGRAFDCNRYEECLDLAACEDWEAFHCENCPYTGRGKIDFYFDDFEFELSDEAFLELWDIFEEEDPDGEYLDTDF